MWNAAAVYALLKASSAVRGSALSMRPTAMGAPASSTTTARYGDADHLGVFLGGVNHLPRRVEGDRPDGRFVLAEEGGVDFDRCNMFGRNVDVFEDRVHRTDDLALLAIDTDFGVDVELRRARRLVWMQATGHTSTQAPSLVHKLVMMYGMDPR